MFRPGASGRVLTTRAAHHYRSLMQLILPEVLSAAHGLSFGAAGFLGLLGVLLWALGWRWHRFWIVFGMTLAAGILGMQAGHAAGGRQVLIVGVLLAVSAGMLALEAAKLLAFVTGGVAAWVGVQSLYPAAQELWAVFLCGGLLGVVLYRLWTMLTMSLIGVLISSHAWLILIQETAKPNLVEWVQTQAPALNGVVIALALIGVYLQTRTAERPSDVMTPTEGHEPHHADAAKPHHPPAKPAKVSSRWWKLKAA